MKVDADTGAAREAEIGSGAPEQVADRVVLEFKDRASDPDQQEGLDSPDRGDELGVCGERVTIHARVAHGHSGHGKIDVESIDPLVLDLGGKPARQIIKGWVDVDGEMHEQIVDVAWSDSREKGSDGKLLPVGNTVDLQTARYTNEIGATQVR